MRGGEEGDGEADGGDAEGGPEDVGGLEDDGVGLEEEAAGHLDKAIVLLGQCQRQANNEPGCQANQRYQPAFPNKYSAYKSVVGAHRP